MKPALSVFTVSVGQALPLRRSIMLLMLQIAPAAVYVLATQNRTEDAAFRGAVEIGASTFFALVLPVTAIVIAAGVLGNERRDLTLSFIALRPMPRITIAVAKMLAAVVAGFAITSVGAVALGFAHGVRYGSWTLLAGLVVGALVAVSAYCGIYVPLGFVTDRAVIIGISILLVFENGIAFALTGLAFLSPWRLGVSAMSGIVVDARTLSGAENVSPYTMSNAVIFALTYLVLGTVITTLILRTRDLA